jgi:hypothetical protein
MYTLLTLNINDDTWLEVTSEESGELSDMFNWITVKYKSCETEVVVYDDSLCEFFHNMRSIIKSAVNGRLQSKFSPSSLGFLWVLDYHGLLREAGVLYERLNYHTIWGNRKDINALTFVATENNQILFETITTGDGICDIDDVSDADKWIKLIEAFRVKARFRLANDKAKQWLAKSEEIIRSWGTGELDVR